MTNLPQPQKVLVIHYSQTGQLSRVAKSVVSPLECNDDIQVDFLKIQPVKPYPFPWPFLRFINTFPEAVHERGCAIQPISPGHQKYDLVILAYQVWFLAPSNPIMAFLKSEAAKTILKGTPIITVIACRDMWLQAQERVKKHLKRLDSQLIGNIALVDEAGSAMSFFSTPLWMLTGRRGPFKPGIPAAGVSELDIRNADRFGYAIARQLNQGQLDKSVLQGLNAVKINTNQIASEKIGTRSFILWGKLFLLFGGPESPARKVLALFYVTFLLLMIITVVPLNYLLKKILAPLLKKHNQKMRDYYAQPSGEGTGSTP